MTAFFNNPSFLQNQNFVRMLDRRNSMGNNKDRCILLYLFQLILNLAKEGKTVIMVSSEMPELLGVCDRILVMSGGQLAGEVDAKTTTQEEIMTLAAKYA